MFAGFSRTLSVGLFAVVAVLGIAANAHAQCPSGGGGGGGGSRGGAGGGSGSGVSSAGLAVAGATMSPAQAMQAAYVASANQRQFQNPQLQYLAATQSRYDVMMQQVRQHQYRQFLAKRQASQNKKREAAERATNASYKEKSKSSKSAPAA